MTDRHFLVVGGTKGIGLALVEHLIGEEGMCVSVLGRTLNSALQPSPRLTQHAVDVCDRAMLLSCIDRAVARYGKLASVVFMQRHRGGKSDLEADLRVALVATRDAIDHVVGCGYFLDGGPCKSIVIVSSIADRYVASEQPLGYHVAKAGLSHLARYYARELASSGVRVNVVSPCLVAKDEAREFYEQNKWLVDRFRKFIPLGRMGTPEDIVRAIMFLSGEQASYITGQNLVVDGGLTLLSHGSLIRDFPRED